jgi:hypothetical protein
MYTFYYYLTHASDTIISFFSGIKTIYLCISVTFLTAPSDLPFYFSKQATLQGPFIRFSFFCYYREERRIRKWRKMIGVGGSDWKHYVRRNPHVVKRRIRKGIPDCLRGLVWQLISGSRDLLLMNPGVYEVPVRILFFPLQSWHSIWLWFA